MFLKAAKVSDWLVDTGIGDDTAGTAEMAASSGNRAWEVVRLEQVAEQAAQAPGDYASAFEEILHRRAATAVGTKSILAYRGGFDGDLTEPSAPQVAEAAGRWRDRGGTRLQDRVLLRFGLHQALRLGKPLQFHVGFGDRDCDLHKANPLLLLNFLRQSADTPIVLLHCYPYEREAGYLAQAFNNVYLDGGLSVNHLGARRRRSSRGCSRWRPSARSCTPRTVMGPRNCTSSVRPCGARVFTACSADLSPTANGASAMPSGWST